MNNQANVVAADDATQYRFRGGNGRIVAILRGGTITCYDEGGSLDSGVPVSQFFREMMGKPMPSDPKAQIASLCDVLGASIEMIAPPSLKLPRKDIAARAESAAKSAERKANHTPVARITPREPSSELPKCMCGCGEYVLNIRRSFRQGHDAKFHSMIKKLERGEKKLADLPESVQEWAVANKIKNAV